MTNERLMFEVGRGLREANRILQAGWRAQRLSHKAAVLMQSHLQGACLAAGELRARTELTQRRGEAKGAKKGKRK